MTSTGQQPAAQADNGGTDSCEHEWEYWIRVDDTVLPKTWKQCERCGKRETYEGEPVHIQAWASDIGIEGESGWTYTPRR